MKIILIIVNRPYTQAFQFNNLFYRSRQQNKYTKTSSNRINITKTLGFQKKYRNYFNKELILRIYTHSYVQYFCSEKLHQNNQINNTFPFIFGEIGVVNVSGLMPVNAFLESAGNTSTITLAWLFNRNTNDQNALLTDDGEPNNTNNNNWGSTYKLFLSN